MSDASLDEIWTRGLMVFDTNTLLRLYRYKKSTSDEILKVWEGLGGRLWIPYQVAWEYNNNRGKKVKESRKSYTDIVDILKDAGDKVTVKLNDLKDFGVHPNAQLEGDLGKIARDILEKTQEVSSKYEANPTGDHYASIHDNIGNIFEGKIGNAPTDADLTELFKSGQSRFDNGMPPGLRDVPDKKKMNRPDREVFGDYLLWREVLVKAKAEGLPVIFVTEDAKDDWWLKEDGKTIGILPQLRGEFIRETGADIHFYRIAFFLEQAKVRLSANISSDSVADVGRLEESQIYQGEISNLDSELDLNEKLSRLVFLHQFTNDGTQTSRDIFLRDISEWGSENITTRYNLARDNLTKTRANYRKFSKIERSAAAQGVGSGTMLLARSSYMQAKKEFEQARLSLEKQLNLIRNYYDNADGEE